MISGQVDIVTYLSVVPFTGILIPWWRHQSGVAGPFNEFMILLFLVRSCQHLVIVQWEKKSEVLRTNGTWVCEWKMSGWYTVQMHLKAFDQRLIKICSYLVCQRFISRLNGLPIPSPYESCENVEIAGVSVSPFIQQTAKVGWLHLSQIERLFTGRHPEPRTRDCIKLGGDQVACKNRKNKMQDWHWPLRNFLVVRGVERMRLLRGGASGLGQEQKTFEFCAGIVLHILNASSGVPSGEPYCGCWSYKQPQWLVFLPYLDMNSTAFEHRQMSQFQLKYLWKNTTEHKFNTAQFDSAQYPKKEEQRGNKKRHKRHSTRHNITRTTHVYTGQ